MKLPPLNWNQPPVTELRKQRLFVVLCNRQVPDRIRKDTKARARKRPRRPLPATRKPPEPDAVPPAGRLGYGIDAKRRNQKWARVGVD